MATGELAGQVAAKIWWKCGSLERQIDNDRQVIRPDIRAHFAVNNFNSGRDQAVVDWNSQNRGE